MLVSVLSQPSRQLTYSLHSLSGARPRTTIQTQLSIRETGSSSMLTAPMGNRTPTLNTTFYNWQAVGAHVPADISDTSEDGAPYASASLGTPRIW
jgi:hypothetical protein